MENEGRRPGGRRKVESGSGLFHGVMTSVSTLGMYGEDGDELTVAQRVGE